LRRYRGLIETVSGKALSAPLAKRKSRAA
jgi:hypothetical protein